VIGQLLAEVPIYHDLGTRPDRKVEEDPIVRPGGETQGVCLLVDATFSSCILELAGAGRLHALTRVWANSRALIAYWVMRSGFDRRAVPPFEKVNAIWAGATEARNWSTEYLY
jgi:hypothetical protein